MTLDDLAGMVARGFSDVNEKMDRGFASVNGRLDKVEDRLEKVEATLEKVENHHGRRLDNLEDKHRIVASAFDKNFDIKLAK